MPASWLDAARIVSTPLRPLTANLVGLPLPVKTCTWLGAATATTSPPARSVVAPSADTAATLARSALCRVTPALLPRGRVSCLIVRRPPLPTRSHRSPFALTASPGAVVAGWSMIE